MWLATTRFVGGREKLDASFAIPKERSRAFWLFRRRSDESALSHK
jgi:hypothetical protein